MGKVQIIEKLFLHIAIYSYLILPLFIFFSKERKGFPFAIVLYGIIAFILLKIYDILPDSLEDLYFIFYTSFEYSCFAYFIFVSIQNKKIKQLILSLSICFIIFQVVFGSRIYRLDSVSIGIETILLFIYIFLFFYDHSKNNKTGYIYNHPTFWLSVGILLYLGGSFFFNILVGFMSIEEVNSYWHYSSIAEIIKNLLFGVAILITSRQHKLSSPRQSQIPYLDIDMN